VMKKNGWDFKEALQHLAERAGVELQQYTPQQEEQKEQYDSLRDLLEEAVLYYRNHLLQNPDVLDYLHNKRGLTDATIETFGLGYAPHGWDNALKHFTERGYSEQDLIDSGLLTVREDDETGESANRKVYDRFRHRLMIPIRDERGRMAGFGARALDENERAKYLNSPQTVLFDKGRLLYGLDRARKPIRAADQVVIVEGYLDVIAPHQAGFENVVSPMGTALTEDQLRLLKRFTRKIVLALDPDAAGQKAILRGLDAARLAMQGVSAPVVDQQGIKNFDAPGLIKFADRLDASISAVILPDGLDPDEIVNRNPDEWEKIIGSAKPIILYVADMLIQERDVSDPKVNAEIVAELTPIIESVSNPVERDVYRQTLARQLKIDERVLIPPRFGGQTQGPRTKRPRRRKDAEPQQYEVQVIKTVSPSYKAEIYCLAVLFRRPELLHKLDRQLQEAGLQRLINDDFGYTDHQMLLDLIRESLEQDKVDHHQYVVEHVPEALKELAEELLQQTQSLDPLEEKILEELKRIVRTLRRKIADESIQQIRFLQEEAQQAGDALRVKEYTTQMVQYTVLRNTLDQASMQSSRRLKN